MGKLTIRALGLLIAGILFSLQGGGIAHGAYLKSNPLIIKDVHQKNISNLIISNTKQPCIQLINCKNIVIKNCRLSNSKAVAIYMYRCKNVTVTNCYIENVSTGVYTLESTGIKVLYNQVKNVTGPFPRGQMVQFDDVNGEGNCVNYNKCENIAGASNPEDVISMYKSGGTAASPIQITGNLIRGGGPSKTGGGIMLGDNGGAYIIAKDNILVNPGQYGMAISGGTHMTIINNKIYSRQQAFTNVGLYVWNQTAALGCAFNYVGKNQVNWVNKSGEQNSSWNQGNCGPVDGWDTNIWSADINSHLLPAIFIKKN